MSRRANLFTLPLELRHRIYSFLLPPSPTSHPLPSVGLTAVSHRPPSSAILNIHPIISDEILEYYYTITTWKLIFSHAFNFFRVDPELKGLERSTALSRLRKVEIVFYCDILLLGGYNPRGGMDAFCYEIRRRADRACSVLLQAEKLRVVTVSWIDTTGCDTPTYFDSLQQRSGSFSLRIDDMLSPVRKLLLHPSGPLTFKIGFVNAPSREWFAKAITKTLKECENQSLYESKHGGDSASDDREQVAKIRMLAFDVQQDRRSLHREQEQALYWGCGP